jgi:hypothetical protein
MKVVRTKEERMSSMVRRGLSWTGALALAAILAASTAGVVRAQNIPNRQPNMPQTWTGKVIYKDTAGTNYGVVGVFNENERYAKEFKLKKDEFEKLDVKKGDQVEVSWVNPRKDRTDRKDIKIKKISGPEN